MTTKLEKFYVYKEKLIILLENLQQAHEALRELFDEEETFDCNDFICDDYPFEKSFEEINIADWIYSISKNLAKYEVKLYDEQKCKNKH